MVERWAGAGKWQMKKRKKGIFVLGRVFGYSSCVEQLQVFCGINFAHCIGFLKPFIITEYY